MTKLLRSLFIAFVLNVLFSSEGQAATIINAVNCSAAAVLAAVNAAPDGGTVAIPACPGGVSWPTTLTVTKGITVQGAGIGVTVLLDGVPKGDAMCANANPMIRFTGASPARWRLTALTIRGSATDLGCQPGHVAIGGTSKAWRVDHVRIENQQTVGIRIGGDTWGVIDHTDFEGNHKQGVIVSHFTWGGRTYGDGSWADPLYLGTERAVYIEDCTFTDPNPSGAGAVDMFDGGRVVFRYNTAAFMGNHGTDSSGRRRSARSYEIYNNTFTAWAPAAFTAILLRGGTGVIYNNTFKGDYVDIINATNYRDTQSFPPWGRCDGKSPYDQNQSPTGYACIDQVGRSTGDLLSGDTPPPAWPTQALEPVYQWSNMKNGANNPVLSSLSSNIQVNRDFFNNMIKPGYTAFPYPHPLTLSGPRPSPPTNVRAQ